MNTVKLICTRGALLLRRLYRAIHRVSRRWIQGGIPMHTRDDELGGIPPAEEAYGMSMKRVVVCLLVFATVMYVLPNLVHYIVVGKMHDNATDTGRLLRHPGLLHSIIGHNADTHADDPPADGMYRDLRARLFLAASDVPEFFAAPCREITQQELRAGLLIENYEIPLLLMRMCEIVHEVFGCDGEGYIIPKLVDTPNALNVCIMTYKEASGICSHYINPIGKPILNANRPVTGADIVGIEYENNYFPYEGIKREDFYADYMLTYQPIIEEQALHDKVGDEAIPDLADGYRKVERAYVGGWLQTIPKVSTIVLSRPLTFYYQMGERLMRASEYSKRSDVE